MHKAGVRSKKFLDKKAHRLISVWPKYSFTILNLQNKAPAEQLNSKKMSMYSILLLIKYTDLVILLIPIPFPPAPGLV